LYDIIDASGRKIRGPEAWRLVHPASVPPFGNGPLMYRREVFEDVGGYRRQCEFWEDHDLIIRMGSVSTIMIVPHAVYQVRQSPVSTRFASEQRRVERALDLMYRCRHRLEQHRAYDDLLDAPTQEGARIDPRVFISAGSMALWSGGKPRLFRRLLKRGNLRFDSRTLGALVWTAWASIEPRTLRAFIRSLLLTRRVRASFAVKTTGPVIWTAPIVTPRDAKMVSKPEHTEPLRRSTLIQGTAPARTQRSTSIAAE
jgi:hypothetical protein